MNAVRQHCFRVRVVGRGESCAVMAAGLAELGHEVSCRLRQLGSDSDDPALWTSVREAVESGRLSFTDDLVPDVLVVCGADRDQISESQQAEPGERVLVNTCVPPWESTPEVADFLDDPDLSVVSNPIELRGEGALRDFLNPERIIIGGDDERAIGVVEELYRGLDSPVLRSDVRSADLIAPATNAYCAVRHRYFEQLADLCAMVGADVHSVVECLRYDDRIECDGALLPGRAGEIAGVDRLLDMARGTNRTPMLRAFVD